MGNNESQQEKASGKSSKNNSLRCKTDNLAASTSDDREPELESKKSKPLLNSYQKSLLIKSWNHHSYRHCHGAENIGVKIYFKIFERYPEVKKIFGFENLSSSQLLFNEKFIKQAKNFITVTDDALKKLDDLETKVQPSLFALGGRHVKLRDRGFKHQHWDVFAESMLECIIESQGIHRQRDVPTVWRIFISWMIAVMKDGYFYTLKNERTSSSPVHDNLAEKGISNNNDGSNSKEQHSPSNNSMTRI